MHKIKIINVFCGSELFTGKTAAVMAPAGGSECILPFFLPADVFPYEILPNGLPFVEDDACRPRIFQRFCQPIADGFIFGSGQFGLEGAEQLVPDNEEHAHVLVEVLHVRGMVDPVMGGGDQDILQPTHLADEFCMDENAPYLGGRVHKDDIHRLKAQ